MVSFEKELKRQVVLMNAIIWDAGVGVMTMDAGAKSDRYVSFAESQFELALELKFEIENAKLRRLMRYLKFEEGAHPVSWIPFEITDQGIKIQNADMDGKQNHNQ